MERCRCGHAQSDHDATVGDASCVRCECDSFDPTNDNADGPMSPEDFEDGRRPEIMTLPSPMPAAFCHDDHLRHLRAATEWEEFHHAKILNAGFIPPHTERGRHGHHDEGRC